MSEAADRRGRVRTAIAGVAVAALAVVALQPAGADENDLDGQVAAASDDLADANATVARAAAALRDAEAKLPAARAQLTRAQAALTAAQDADRIAAARVVTAEQNAARAGARVVDAQNRVTEVRDDLGGFARSLYTQGAFAELELVLDADTPGDFTARLAAVDTVARVNNDALAQLGAAGADLALLQAKALATTERVAQAKAAAEAAVAAAKQTAAEAAAAKAEVDRLVRARAAALAVAQAERDRVRRQYEALKAAQAEAARVAAEAARQERERRERERREREQREREQRDQQNPTTPPDRGNNPDDNGDPDPGPGGLTWPIPGGGVSQKVGPRIHPVYGYRSCHTGIDVRGSYGTPIRAAADGVVASIANGGPFGLHTYLAHGGGMVTMYAHQSSTAVRSGQQVRAGQVIGYVGTSGWVTGAHLHWEVHLNGVPYDPLGWFGGSKSPVRC